MSEYRRTRASELQGRRALTLVELRNGYCRLKAGSVVTIRGKRGGLALEGPTCRRCGVSLFMNRVAPADVELLPQ